jgi:hypothetical protein
VLVFYKPDVCFALNIICSLFLITDSISVNAKEWRA